MYATDQVIIGDTAEQSIIANPGFINTAKGDYRLSPTSPARAALVLALQPTSAELISAGPDGE